MSKYFIPLVLILALIIDACDKVEYPILPEVVIADSGYVPTIDSNAIYTASRKVLVEEFTGHKCTGCPTQTRKLITMQESNEPKIIILSYHAGPFAELEIPDYPTEFRTDHGNALYQSVTPIAAFPTAMVNRVIDADDNFKYLGHDKWKVPINDQLNDAASIGVGVASVYDDSLKLFRVRVSAKALEDLTNEYRLVVICFEDSVIAEQLDNGVYDPAYAHRHVVRAEANNSEQLYGDVLVESTGLKAGEWVGKVIVLPLPENVVTVEKCGFVAYIINSATNVIAQSEECHVEVLP